MTSLNNKGKLKHIASALAFYGKYGIKAAAEQYGVSKQTIYRWENIYLKPENEEFIKYYDEEIEALQDYHRKKAAKNIKARSEAQAEGHENFQESALMLLNDFQKLCKELKAQGENLVRTLSKEELYFLRTASEIYDRHCYGESNITGINRINTADNAQKYLEGLSYIIIDPETKERRKTLEDSEDFNKETK